MNKQDTRYKHAGMTTARPDFHRERWQFDPFMSNVNRTWCGVTAIILRRAEGIRQVQVSAELGLSVVCVSKWSQRFQFDGLAGLCGKEGR